MGGRDEEDAKLLLVEAVYAGGAVGNAARMKGVVGVGEDVGPSIEKKVGGRFRFVDEFVWTFEDGAVVELRSGSAPMTVCASLRGRDGVEYVQVTYWSGVDACQVYDLLAVRELKRMVAG